VIRRAALCAAIAIAIAPVTTLGGAEPASAAHVSKRCGLVSKGSRDYRVRARVITCASARRWVRAYLRNRARPRGWRCVRQRTGRTPFFCTRGPSKAYWAERLG
jgi:hypothetical protein